MTGEVTLAPTLADSESFDVHRRMSSDNPTFESSACRRIMRADSASALFDNRHMSEKPTKRASTPTDQLSHRWYFAEHAQVHNYSQADAERALGWPRGKVSALWNGKQRYNQEAVDQVADWLKIEPYELLMTPDEAIAIKQLRSAARAIAATQKPTPKTPARASL